ncbi:hypothetical protein BDR26DRAFT_485842 [Obelidium mucronatum]|nr:hypothetical protein BDR26DRAFT_485842 [Obelidium mucronatum]
MCSLNIFNTSDVNILKDILSCVLDSSIIIKNELEMDQQIGFPRVVSDEYQSILAENNPKNWAIFGYDKMSNDLKVLGSGEDGLEELAEEWDDSKILYAFARVIEPISKLPKLVFISWCGDGVPVAKKGLFHHHVNDAVKFFRGFHVHINARAEIDVTPDAIMKKVKDSSGAKYSIHNEQAKKSGPVQPVGSSYTPVQTVPKPMSAAPPAFNKPASYVPQFNKPTTATSSYSQPRTSNVTSPSVKQSTFSPIPAPTPISAVTPALKGICAKAVFTYEANESNEISFAEGEIVSEIEKLDEGWWQGKNTKGQVGLFPNNYVEEIKATAPPAVASPAVSAPPPLFNRPSVSGNSFTPTATSYVPPSPQAAAPVATASIPSRPSVTSPSTFQPYMSSSANAWLGDDDSSSSSRPSKASPYTAGFPISTPAEDRVALEKERREREDRELRERAEAEARERDEREKREAAEKEERQRAAALAATATFAAPISAGVSARAIYLYDAQESNEISFAEGELITAIEKHDEGWWQGKNAAGHVGLFPATYVEEVSSSNAAVHAPPPPPPAAAPIADQIEAIALYDYQATEQNELSFAAGDRITNIVFVSDDWWQGRHGGQDGLCKFP